jgi:hypothetical protein
VRATNVATLSGLMSRHDTDKHFDVASIEWSMDLLWKKLVTFSTIYGPLADLGDVQQRYDRACLDADYFDKVLKRLPAHIRKLNRVQQPQERYSISMWLSTMAFADKADLEILQLLAMSSKSPQMRGTIAPTMGYFQVFNGIHRHKSAVHQIVQSSVRQFELCPQFNTPRLMNEKIGTYKSRRHRLWQSAQTPAVRQVVDALVAQFPASVPQSVNSHEVSVYIDVHKVMGSVRELFQSWHDNNLLHQYMESMLQSLANLSTTSVSLPVLANLTASSRASNPRYFTVLDLFLALGPHVPKLHGLPQISMANRSAATKPRCLPALIDQLARFAGSSGYELSYANDLRSSMEALITQGQGQSADSLPTLEALTCYQEACGSHVQSIYGQLLSSIKSLENSNAEQATQHWPRVSPSLILQQLAHDRVTHLPQSWKISIVNYGLAITSLQQADRLVALAKGAHSQELLNELRNPGHVNWNPHDYPESLLMEVESGIMIREVQEQIASEMRAPSSVGNSVMQLNMGEGKSTVIIPMVAAALANGHQLVRVIVAKPQSKQMAQMMIAKFGGLVGRRIYYMPFSRSLALTPSAAEAIDKTLRQCMATGGILLVQPEHLLSFKLMAPECFISGKGQLGQTLMKTHDFFDDCSRDIVDESDENFSVRFELIYTMGMQQSIELSPDRWFLMQQVLDIIKHLVPDISRFCPTSIEVSSSDAGGFPRIRLLKADTATILIQRVASHIRDNGLEGFPISRQPQSMRDAIFTYMTTYEVNDEVIQFVERGEFWDACQASILLLRGLLAGGVLAFAFGQKRWRVNYGLAIRSPTTKFAVPYRAKDNPSPRSEFSHPDVVITLTSLCYYYGGLSDDDMFTALGHLMDSDQADAEYQAWIKYVPSLPVAFRQLQGINLKDEEHCKSKLFSYLRRVKAVVDYFLSHIVFPKEMKEFPHKLSASGWDIGKKKDLATTGFSGTNDSRRLLPLYVDQLDLQEQKHTNALVLEYLLQPVNRIELVSSVAQQDERLTDAEHLLRTAVGLDPPVQVILDVGAQILELDNLGVAKAWLEKSDTTIEAVVFVSDADELCVVDRKGRVDLLQISPFATRLDACLVFLDESHTRGIDLKLPVHYRAIVTLGANLSKDRLVQACMRLRNLGKGQSVTFCVSPEIQTKIREHKSLGSSTAITVEDVLLWSISETHTETRRGMPLWTVQGERFIRNETVWQTMKKDGKTKLSKVGSESLLEAEAQSIDDRYRPRKAESQPNRLANADDLDLRRIAERCRNFDGLQFRTSALQEEQERELSPEIERERQVQKAKPADPATHYLHPDVKKFALSGILATSSKAYMPAFESLKHSTAAYIFAPEQLTGEGKLLVTADFTKCVVETSFFFQSDAFQRSVQWVLTANGSNSTVVDCIMIVSEYEANLLLPRMEIEGSMTTLHKYKARSNEGYDPLDHLDLFAVSGTTTRPVVPRPLSVQLALFAGQLYVSSYDDYLEICKFLGLSASLLTKDMEDAGWRVGNDGFILDDGRGNAGGTSRLSKSPIPFFKILMSKIRRNGDGISKTDMGRLLEGKPFQKSHWENKGHTGGDRMEID